MKQCKHYWQYEGTLGTCKYCGKQERHLDYWGLDRLLLDRVHASSVRGALRTKIVRALDITEEEIV